jgi:hypothetical protein
MPIAAQTASSVDVFNGAREELERMIGKLREGGARAHTEVIGELREGGAEVQRRLLQGWLDRLLAAERDERPMWVLAEGARVRERERGLEIEFGRVCVRRHGVTMPGETVARFPMDGHLNLPPELYGLSLREEIAAAAAEASFDRSVERVDHATAGHVPKRQAEQLVVRAATDFETFYSTRTMPANDGLTPQAFQLMSSDGKGVTMRPEALRDATRKAAEAAAAAALRGDPMAERKARRSDKRMAVVTAVWEQEPHVRTAEDVLERLHRDPAGRKRRPRAEKAPRPQNKRVAASLTKTYAEGVAEMFDEAQRRNPKGERRNVLLIDGDEKQIEYAEAESRKRDMNITVVLDLIHVIHYLWTIALLLCAGVRAEADAWVSHILLQLLTRHPLDVVATIRQTATNRGLVGKNRRAVDDAIEYLRKNSLYLDYARFLAEGLPIASGVIEGACRHLVQDRMGITGARWALVVAEAILKLRALRASDDWDEYWRFHLDKESERNHHYATAA